MATSRDHELHVELFRSRPELARVLLKNCAGIELADGIAELTTIDASQAMPVEARCDAVIVFRSHTGIALHAVIVEVQNQEDRDKRNTWPLYVTALRARLSCPVLLLVLAPVTSVAAWAREPIETGHPGFSLSPIVIGYEDLPRITHASEVEVPELAVLSARAHRDLEVARVAATALVALPKDLKALYWNFLISVLPALVRNTLEAEMNPEQIQTAIAEMSFERGIEQGIEQGIERGETKALRRVAASLAATKLGNRFDATLEERIRVADASELDALVALLIASNDPAEILALFARLS